MRATGESGRGAEKYERTVYPEQRAGKLIEQYKTDLLGGIDAVAAAASASKRKKASVTDGDGASSAPATKKVKSALTMDVVKAKAAAGKARSLASSA